MPRPRKPGPRTGRGRLSRSYKGSARDTGTPELQAKRTALVGDGDPALASTALGCIFARRSIDKGQYAAGLEFGKLHAALYQRWRGTTGLEACDARVEELKRRFDAMVDLLTDVQRLVLTDVCAFNVWPQWFFNERLGLPNLPEDKAQLEALTDGLKALAIGTRKMVDKRSRLRVEADMSQLA